MKLADVEKAAVLLIALGPDRSGPILDRLGSLDLLPLVSAMKRMRKIPAAVRRAVLVEVNRILHQLSSEKPNRTRMPSEDEPPEIFRRLGSSLPSRIDPDRVDWDDVGSGDGPRWDEPELPSPPRPPGDEP